ncbi:hypothetical protein NL676_026379 [Syzygium grande]|nr:hypothetical protein NL676_026379 [Syzygium grande]
MKITQGIGRAPNCSCFPNLVDVWVHECRLSDLSWLVHAPKLRELRVISCDSMERIIGDGFAREELADSGLFSRLEFLELYSLPKLTSICDQALSFPQRVIFRVRGCHGLRKLPLDSSSARGSFEVWGDQSWWAEFEWDPTARVTVELGGMGPTKEMTFGEASFGGVSSSDAIEPHLLLLLKEMCGRHRYCDMVDDASRRFYSRHTHRRTPPPPPWPPNTCKITLKQEGRGYGCMQ